MFSSNRNDCRLCVQSLDDYCAHGARACVPLEQWTCRGNVGIVNEVIQRGCGYVHVSYYGDVGDEWGQIFDETTGKVVYVWNNGRLSSGCTDAVQAGTMTPPCAGAATITCAELMSDGGAAPDSGGAGGSGGAGSDAGSATGGAGGRGGTDAGQSRCGNQSCGTTEVCVAYRTIGGGLITPTDAGRCPNGSHGEPGGPSGSHCAADYGYRCVPLVGCAGTDVRCSCATGTCPSGFFACSDPSAATVALDPAAQLICQQLAP
jgi:hypothetical protein